jgi:hypothetical protein
MEGQAADADGPSEALSNHVAAAAPAAPADPQQDAAEALLHSQHTGDEDEIAEVDPQNRYYRYTACFNQPVPGACPVISYVTANGPFSVGTPSFSHPQCC